MDYKGSAIRLQVGELKDIANQFGLNEAHIKTVIAVETSGKGFNNMGWVEFLFEPHKFYQNVPKAKLAEAIKQGLAYPKWRGPGSYPKTVQLRVQQFQKAAALDETAAIKSASWGLGQIMGSECVEAGYPSPQAMLEAFADSEANQVKGMCNLIKHRGLDKDLHNFPDMTACRHFALRYNGARYADNNYHNKLHDAYVRLSGHQAVREDVSALDPMADGILRFGESDKEKTGGPIWTMQNKFKSLGYSLLVDGKFGAGTRSTILAWKANEGVDTTSADMSEADLAMLEQAQAMPVAAERATATAEDLKPTSTIVQKTSLGQKLLGWTTGLTGGASVLGGSGMLDSAQDTVDKARQATGVVSSAKGLIADTGVISLIHVIYEWRFPILAVVVLVGIVLFNQIQKKRVEMHQKAEIA